MYQIELYKENGYFCAYIGEDGGSGYKIRESSESECARKIADYIEDIRKLGGGIGYESTSQFQGGNLRMVGSGSTRQRDRAGNL